jgi:hypothetical protein
MRIRYGMSMIAAAGLCLLASQAAAQFPPITDPNKDEIKCQTGAAKALQKFVGSKAKCSAKCLATARKTSGPYPPCFAPYSDTATQACIYDPLKGAAAKARASIAKACSADCPECYTSQDPNLCSTGDPLVSNTDTQTNLFGQLVYCLENGGTTPTAVEAKCESAVSKTLVKFVGSKSKCYQKCSQNMIKGAIAPGSCTPPTSDPTTATCISVAEGKAAAAIDKVCASAGANPACYVPNFDTGAEWVALTESAVDSNVPNVACGA